MSPLADRSVAASEKMGSRRIAVDEASSLKVMDHVQRPTIAFVLTWPQIKNAEYEVCQRLAAAVERIGARALVVDNDGYPLWARDGIFDPHRRISVNDCLFAISFHFESPRLYDVYSYAALWNPPEFYEAFGYARSTERLASHLDFLSCGAPVADAHAVNILRGLGRTIERPLPRLHHSLAGPYPAPKLSADSKLFYIGINWERISGARGRHQDLLELLDRDGLIAIYGPEEFQGVRPWEGFNGYRGSIPFDGSSVVREINEAGICLVLSSEAHRRSGIMSNRLFEGLAAGAAIIATPHPFIEEHFADLVYMVDDEDPAVVASRIRSLVLEIRRSPDEAKERAAAGQRRLVENFALDLSLSRLVEVHESRRTAHEAETHPRDRRRVSVIGLLHGMTAKEGRHLVAQAASQKGVDVELLVICDEGYRKLHGAEIEALCATSGLPLRWITRSFIGRLGFLSSPAQGSDRLGTALRDAVTEATGDFVIILKDGETWFQDHLATLTRALENEPDCALAASGCLLEDETAGRVMRRRLDTVGPCRWNDVLRPDRHFDAGRVLVRRRAALALPAETYELLHAEAPRALALAGLLAGDPARTSLATFVVCADRGRVMSSGSASECLYLADALSGTARGRELRQGLLAVPSDEALLARGEPLWLQSGRVYSVGIGGTGLASLRHGFSRPEKPGVWIDGTVGVLSVSVRDNPGVLKLTLNLLGRTSANGSTQAITVLVDDEVCIDDEPLGGAEQAITLTLPAEAAARTALSIVIRAKHADVVRDANGLVTDSRHLGVMLMGFQVTSLLGKSIAPLVAKADLTYKTVEGGNGLGALYRGFSHPEASFTWIDGRLGMLRFRLPDHIPATLTLHLGSRLQPSSNEFPTVTVHVSGIECVAATPLRDKLLVDVPLPVSLSPQSWVDVRIKLSAAEHVQGPDGTVVDPRQLGAWISGFELGHRTLSIADLPGGADNTEAIDGVSRARVKLVSTSLLGRLAVALRMLRRR